jgi:hypothetical protein
VPTNLVPSIHLISRGTGWVARRCLAFLGVAQIYGIAPAREEPVSGS